MITSNTSPIETYLKAMDALIGENASSRWTYEGVVLKYGRMFDAPRVPRPKGIRKGRDKACFKNAYDLARQEGFTYVEGFANSIIVVHHAWCYDEKSQTVVETTWRDAGTEYFGIPFSSRFVDKVIFERRYYGVIDFQSETFRKFAVTGEEEV